MAITIDTNDLKAILDTTPATQNILLVGKHGIGKSEIITHYFKEKDIPVIALFLGQMSDPGDLIGLPNKNTATGRTEFMPPYWWPVDGKPVVLFLDEMNRARPEILQSVMDLSLNRRLAGRPLPEGSRVIAAVNDGEEYQLTDLDPALVSRFNVYFFSPTVGEWLLWAKEQGLDQRVIRFIETHSGELESEVDLNKGSFDKTPDRRAWTRVSQLLQHYRGPVQGARLPKMIAGIVGARAASLFIEALRNEHQVEADDVLLAFAAHAADLPALSLPQLTRLNESLYQFLQLGVKAEQEEAVSVNLPKYLQWLIAGGQREAAAHFGSFFADGTYPAANAFIMTKCPQVFSLIQRLINEL